MADSDDVPVLVLVLVLVQEGSRSIDRKMWWFDRIDSVAHTA